LFEETCKSIQNEAINVSGEAALATAPSKSKREMDRTASEKSIKKEIKREVSVEEIDICGDLSEVAVKKKKKKKRINSSSEPAGDIGSKKVKLEKQLPTCIQLQDKKQKINSVLQTEEAKTKRKNSISSDDSKSSLKPTQTQSWFQ
jgi:hypothetical protein